MEENIYLRITKSVKGQLKKDEWFMFFLFYMRTDKQWQETNVNVRLWVAPINYPLHFLLSLFFWNFFFFTTINYLVFRLTCFYLMKLSTAGQFFLCITICGWHCFYYDLKLHKLQKWLSLEWAYTNRHKIIMKKMLSNKHWKELLC